MNEFIELDDEQLIQNQTKLSNKILKTGLIPTDWKYSNLLLHKTGNRHKIENDRPIKLGSPLSKIFSKLIEERLQPILDNQQSEELACFRRTFSTIDHLHLINQNHKKS